MADVPADVPGNDENIADIENTEVLRVAFNEIDLQDPIDMAEKVYQLWWRWANFEVYILDPVLEVFSPPHIIKPDQFENGEYEFVYNIIDHGQRLVTSKAEDMYSAGMSMCRLYYTIEKMIVLLIERLKQSGVDSETEVQIAFDGHELAERKAFESIVNVSGFNIVVTNFNPEEWGERYLQTIKRMAERGYGYPKEAPRTIYRDHHASQTLHPKVKGR